MKTIYNIFEHIRNESSSNKKLEILESNKDNVLLKEILYRTYNPLINYYITNFDEDLSIYNHDDLIGVDNIFNILDKLSSRQISGNEARITIESLTNFMCFETRDILRRIINRDIDAGISTKTINKIWKDLIPEVPYMRCKTFKDVKKIKFPAIVQKKEDAAFFNGIFENGEFKFKTRNGLEFFPTYLKEEFIHILYENNISEDLVIHGELMVVDDNNHILNREISNGLLSSFIKKDQTIANILKKIEDGKSVEKLSDKLTRFQNEINNTDHNMIAVIWDAVPLQDWKQGKSSIPYKLRFEKIKALECTHIRVVESEIVHSIDEALYFYNRMIMMGYEGCVLKNLDGIWQDTSSGSYDQIKMKSEKETDLICTGYVPGEGKYRNGIGSLCCQSSDGLIKVDVPGKSDKMRGFERVDPGDSSKGLKLIEGFDCNCYNNRIFAVKFNALIKNEKGQYSLFLPRFAENQPRFDKDAADSFDMIKKM